MVLGNFMQNPEFRAWKNNQSLIATLAKYFLANGDPINQAEFGLPFFVLSQKTVKLIFYCLTLFLFGLGAWKFLQQNRKMEDNKVISLLFILSVIFSGISWIHSFVFFLFPITYGVREVFEARNAMYAKILFWISVILPIFSGRFFVGLFIENFLLMISILLYSSILLYAAILVLGKDEN